MLVIYEKSTGKIKRILITNSYVDPKTEKKCDPPFSLVAPDLPSKDYAGLSVGEDREVYRNKDNFYVVSKGKKKFLKSKIQGVISIESDLEEREGKLILKKGSSVDFKVSFRDEKGKSVKPKGVLEVSVSRGSVSDRFLELSGKKLSYKVTYQAIDETIPILFRFSHENFKKKEMILELI